MEPARIEFNQTNSASLYAAFNNAYGMECVYHHEILRELTVNEKVSRVAECGVFQGWSTALFMTCEIESLCSYEIDFQHIAPLFLTFMQVKGDIDWSLTAHNSVSEPINPADLVFLDTVHTYEFVKQEIALQAPRASKFVAVHDANYPIDNTHKKVRDAVVEYAEKSNGIWRVVLDSKHDTGFIVIERQTFFG